MENISENVIRQLFEKNIGLLLQGGVCQSMAFQGGNRTIGQQESRRWRGWSYVTDVTSSVLEK